MPDERRPALFWDLINRVAERFAMRYLERQERLKVLQEIKLERQQAAQEKAV